MREKDIERHLRLRVEKLGGLCYKWVSPSNSGVPDRIVMLPGGITAFVEVKSPVGVLSTQQKVKMNKMKELGQKVYVLNSMNKIDELIELIQEEAVNGRIQTP